MKPAMVNTSIPFPLPLVQPWSNTHPLGEDVTRKQGGWTITQTPIRPPDRETI